MQLDDLAPKAGGGRRQLHRFVRFRGGLVPQGLIALNAVLGLGGSGTTPPHDPLPLHTQNRLALALTGLRHFCPLGFQLQIFGVIGLIVIELSPGKLSDVVHHPLQKIAVMGDHHKAALEAAEPVLQPGDHSAVEVVGGLIQHQHICRMDQRRGKGHPLALTAGEGSHLAFKVRKTQLCEHGLGLVFVQGAKLRGKVEKDLL